MPLRPLSAIPPSALPPSVCHGDFAPAGFRVVPDVAGLDLLTLPDLAGLFLRLPEMMSEKSRGSIARKQILWNKTVFIVSPGLFASLPKATNVRQNAKPLENFTRIKGRPPASASARRGKIGAYQRAMPSLKSSANLRNVVPGVAVWPNGGEPDNRRRMPGAPGGVRRGGRRWRGTKWRKIPFFVFRAFVFFFWFHPWSIWSPTVYAFAGTIPLRTATQRLAAKSRSMLTQAMTKTVKAMFMTPVKTSAVPSLGQN
jgi:hypothetical protein